MKTFRIVSLLAALTLLCSCGGEIEPGQTKPKAAAINGLVLGQVSTSALPGGEAYVGSVESPDRGVLAARIDGRVEKVLVAEGDRVQFGEVLLTISDTQAGDRLREAEAAWAEAQGAVAAAEASRRLAEKNYERFQQLFAKEAVTAQEFDRVSAEQEISRQGLLSAQARVSRAAAGVAAAKTALSYTRITAPYTGVVARRQVEAGTTVMPGSPLLTLDREGRWWVRAELPETLTGKILVDAPFLVEIPALERQLQGRVKEILPAADPRSRSFQVKIELESEAQLAVGLFARVRPVGSDLSALLVPASAIVTRGQLTGVYVVVDRTLHYRLVKLGRTIGTQVEILSGLVEGETLVVEGVVRAKNGGRVEE